MKYFITFCAAFVCAASLNAQITADLPIDTAKQDKKHGKNISIGSGGFRYNNGRPDSVEHVFEVQYGMLDLGINSLQDNTDYNTSAAQGFFRNASMQKNLVPKNADLFSLRTSKSINVNVYPLMVKARLYKSPRQRITLATGIGLQLYNFRFTKPITYTANPAPGVILDSVSFSKNKLAFNYLTVPLIINGKTKIASGSNVVKEGSGKGSTNGYWLVYGVGISGGYLLSSWTKQISEERGKEKNHDPFNFRNTNLCVNGEIGLDGFIRLYASYQLTSLHENVLDQHPLCIGIRFLGL